MYQILLSVSVGLKELLIVLSPLNEWSAESGVNKGQTSEYCCLPRLHLQRLWRCQDHCPVWKRKQGDIHC